MPPSRVRQPLGFWRNVRRDRRGHELTGAPLRLPSTSVAKTTGLWLDSQVAVHATTRSLMSRRTWALLGMWVGATVAVFVLWYGASATEPEAPPRRLDGVPIRMPERDRAPSEIRRDQPMTLAPPGPPGMFRGGPRHRGLSGARGPARSRPSWHFETRGRITAQAVVDSEGRVYVGSHDHHLYALTPRGGLRWRRDLGGPIYSTAAIDDEGRIYVGSDASRFFCLDAEGAVVWSIDTEAEADTGVTISPSGGAVYFAAGVYLFAVTLNGQVQWRFRARSKIYSAPAVDEDGTIYVGSQDDHVYALNSEGALRWSYRTAGDVDSSPAIGDEGLIYFGSDDGSVYALDRDGRLVWSTPLGGYVRAPVAVGPTGVVIVSVYGPRPQVVSLGASDGEVRWRFPIRLADSSEVGANSGPLIDADGNVYFGSHDDYLYAVSPRGRLKWVYSVSGDIDASPTLREDGTLLVGSDDGKLYAFAGNP